VRHRARATGRERQARLRTIQGLDLTFLVEGEDDGMFRGIQVQPQYVPQLLHEPGVGRDLEIVDPVRREAMGMPDPRHVALAHAHLLRHEARRPVSPFRWSRLLHPPHDLGVELRRRPFRAPRARLVRADGRQATGLIPIEPQRHGRAGHANLPTKRRPRLALGRAEDDPRPVGEPPRRRARSDDARQLGAIAAPELGTSYGKRHAPS